MALSSTSPQAGVQMAYKNPRHEVKGRLGVTTFVRWLKLRPHTILMSLIERLRRAESCLSNHGKIAGEQLRIIGNTHSLANLRTNSIIVDNLLSSFTKKERREHFLKISSAWVVLVTMWPQNKKPTRP